ncbi:UNVERIFIED_CONTAM: hypothetical protein NCL1_39816 [Trichonephila clavipes]
MLVMFQSRYLVYIFVSLSVLLIECYEIPQFTYVPFIYNVGLDSNDCKLLFLKYCKQVYICNYSRASITKSLNPGKKVRYKEVLLSIYFIDHIKQIF